MATSCSSRGTLPPSPDKHPVTPKLGERVWVMTEKVQAMGIVRYIGAMEIRGSAGTAGGDWVGVELEAPREKGNNGSVQGKVYFRCAPGRGIFVRPKKIFGIIASPSRGPPLESHPGVQDWSPQASSTFGDGSASSPEPQRSPHLAKDLRCRLAEAAENHDAEHTESSLPKTESLCAPSEDVEAARNSPRLEAGNAAAAARSGGLPRTENLKPSRPAASSMEGDIVVDGQRRSQNVAGSAWIGDGVGVEDLTKDSGEFLNRMAQLLSRQDQRFCLLEARLRRLEAPSEQNGIAGGALPPSLSGSIQTWADEPVQKGLGPASAARLRNLSEAVQNLEARMQQHEVTMQGLAEFVDSAATLAIRKEVDGRITSLESRFAAMSGRVDGDRAQLDGRVASMEGLLSALWGCVYGGSVAPTATGLPLEGQRRQAGLSSSSRSRPREDVAYIDQFPAASAGGYPARQQPAPSASGAGQAGAGPLPLAALRSVWARHCEAHGSHGSEGGELPTERLVDVFNDLGFSISDPAKLIEVVDVHKTGKVRFDTFCSTAFRSSAGSE